MSQPTHRRVSPSPPLPVPVPLHCSLPALVRISALCTFDVVVFIMPWEFRIVITQLVNDNLAWCACVHCVHGTLVISHLIKDRALFTVL